MIICAIALLTIPPSIQVEVPVQHVRASRIAAALNGQVFTGPNSDPRKSGASLLPKGVTVKVDDTRGVIILTAGDQEHLDEAKKMASLFDVEPKHLRTLVGLESTIDHYRTESSIESLNNEGWSLVSSDTGLTVEAACRINADGTITLFAKVVGQLGTFSCSWREKNDELATLTIGGQGKDVALNVKTALKSSDVADLHMQGKFPDPLTLTFRPQIVEERIALSSKG